MADQDYKNEKCVISGRPIAAFMHRKLVSMTTLPALRLSLIEVFQCGLHCYQTILMKTDGYAFHPREEKTAEDRKTFSLKNRLQESYKPAGLLQVYNTIDLCG